jgi:acyl carrier protein
MTQGEQRVRAAIARVSEADSTGVASEASLFDAGIIDSFGLADLVASLQEEFGIQIPDSDLHPKNFGSIRAIETYLGNRS